MNFKSGVKHKHTLQMKMRNATFLTVEIESGSVNGELNMVPGVWSFSIISDLQGSILTASPPIVMKIMTEKKNKKKTCHTIK